MTLTRTLLTTALLAACAVGSAEAIPLTLNYAGFALSGSMANGDLIPAGTSFDLHATFTPTLLTSDTGYATYAVDALDYSIGGIHYSLADADLAAFTIILNDPSSAFSTSNYAPVLNEGSGVAVPLFTGTDPTGFDVTHPTPTVFTGYQSNPDIIGALGFAVPGIGYNTVYIDGASFDSSITASVPEPSSLALLLGGAASTAARRRSSPPPA